MKGRDMLVTVMRRTGEYYTSFKGSIRVSKNFNGDKWFVIKDLSDEEVELCKADKDYVCHEFPVDEFYIILN